MKEPYPLCQKHGVAIDYRPSAYVSWAEWRRWKEVDGNQALMNKLPPYATAVTVCEWGIPACDVEMWLAMATKARPIRMEEVD